MAVYYQKYRPQTFADVVGQEVIVQTLRNAAESGQLAHAYLFTGSRGVGKTTLARILAKAANCLNLKAGDPCGKCGVCAAVASGTSLDIIEIDAASHTGVDNVREFIEHAQFRPASMKQKIFIIDEVHMLSKAAFNALLKTLEEPPEHATFILATTDIEKVPATIASRTQRFDFKRINPPQMTKFISEIAKTEKLKLPDGAIEAVVAQAEGSMRDALTRLDMVASMATSKGNKISLEEIEQLLGVTSLATVQEVVELVVNRDSAKLPDFFDNTLSKGVDAGVLNRSILIYLRRILNAKLTGKIENEGELFTAQVNNFALPQLLFTVRLFLRSYKELAYAPSPELPLLLASIEASMFGQGNVAAAAAVTAPMSASVSAPAPIVTSAPAVAKTEPKVTPEEGQELNSQLSSDITLEQLIQWWPEVINKVKVENSPVATLLKNSPVIEVEDGRITVGVKYLFHKEHLDNKKHSALIVETITAVSGKNLMFRSVIHSNQREPALVQTVDAISDALKVFGGELVE